MTMALCLNCGGIKLGALCACHNCQAEATGDQNLDVYFTDWIHSIETLEYYGAVIREIHSHGDSSENCFWAFMLFVTNTDPGAITITLDPEVKGAATEVLLKCTFPPMIVSAGNESP